MIRRDLRRGSSTAGIGTYGLKLHLIYCINLHATVSSSSVAENFERIKLIKKISQAGGYEFRCRLMDVIKYL